MSELKFYSLDRILEEKCIYNIIFGERSNGKTFSVLEYIIKRYQKNGEQGALIRRWKEDFRGKRGETLFDSIIEKGKIKEITNGKWDRVRYYSGRWYLAREQDEKIMYEDSPFMYGFSLSDVEHDKSTSYPKVTTIMFDEFLTRQYYLPDEFVTFMNVVSTIVRQRNNVKIFMLGNTVNKYCPYFTEMGLTHIDKMKKGSIEVYTYGESKLRVAVEYADSISKEGKPSDVYFAFDNPKLSMITGGDWEIALYPHLPYKYTNKNIVFTFFIDFNDKLLQCECVSVEGQAFIYIHRKTTPLKHPDSDLIYSYSYNSRPNVIRNIRKSRMPVNRKIAWYFNESKVFYQDNEIGEIVRNYLVQCQHDVIN